MTIDFAGFGNSQDPLASSTPREVDLETETEAAIAYLVSLSDVNHDRIGVIGHSLGADPALRVGLANTSVATIVLIGPPRRVQERFYDPGDQGFFWYRVLETRKNLYGRDVLPDWYTYERWLSGILSRDMVYMLPQLAGLHHKPVLFIDGERELVPDHHFLAHYAAQCTFPKGYLTLRKTDHDCNVHEMGGHIIFDPAALTQVGSAIDNWCAETMQGRPSLGDYSRNVGRWLFDRRHIVMP